MSFGKPFKAKPVRPGAHERARQVRRRRSASVATAKNVAGLAALAAVAAFAATHRTKIPVYYPNCAAARAAGAAPIHRGSPGYRDALDADGDGIACEPYHGGY